ncbi:MAG: hypothetical protein KF851_01775 [Pirellulaceae bacterium]|nr:hypothetical protein [Pirellulaceae bacterium]
MNKKVVLTVAGLVLFCGVAAWSIAQPLPIQDPQPTLDKKPFMQRKVESSSKLLEALATENYEAIKRYSQELLLLSHESNWNTIQTPDYIEHSREFRVVVSRLRDTADEKNVDAATLGYIDLTMSCVRCHKHLRSAR